MQFLRDLRYGLRVLKSRPAFTAVAVLTLAIGIAVNTTVFTWIDAVLLHPLPGVGDPARLALLETVTPDGKVLNNTSYTDYRDYRDHLKLASLAIARSTPLSMGADGRTSRAWAELVSANYFDLLQVKPVLGRSFLPSEGGDQPGAYPVAVISHQLWRERFGSDPKVLGRTIRLNRHELTIVGVAPPEFHGTLVGVVFDVWMPITMAPAMGTGKYTLTYRATRDITATILRLKPGVTVEQARAEAGALGKQLAAMYPGTNRGVDLTVVPVWAGALGAQGLLLKPLGILMAVAVLLLLIVCANVANLLLARAVARQREFAIRLSLGAERSRVARQLLTEALVLAGAGAVIGVVLSLWLMQSLYSLFPPTDMVLDFGGKPNGYSLAFTLAVAVTATLFSGTAPALLSARANLSETLKEGGRSAGPGAASRRLRGLLVVTEMALAVVALIGAGLFYRSFQNATRIQPGFRTDHVSVSQFYLSYAGYNAQQQRDFCRTLRRNMEAIPGVVGMTYSDVVQMTSSVGYTPWHEMEIEGYTPARDEQMMIHRATVPPGYFDFMGIRLLAGRDFTEQDEAGKPLVIIVNETFARRYFGGAYPIGRKGKLEGESVTVVGMVKDSKYHHPTEAPIPFFYIPFRQWFAPGLNFTVLLRTEGDPMRMTGTLQRQALALNQDAVFTTQPLTQAITVSLYAQTVAASMLGAVGGVCVLLAAIGLFSVMTYAVSQRTQELGIRMALGAQPASVRWMVVREGLKLTVPGLAAGLAASVLVARLVGDMLVKVPVTDPVTFGAAALLLGLVAALASYLPALRATWLDPMKALRRD